MLCFSAVVALVVLAVTAEAGFHSFCVYSSFSILVSQSSFPIFVSQSSFPNLCFILFVSQLHNHVPILRLAATRQHPIPPRRRTRLVEVCRACLRCDGRPPCLHPFRRGIHLHLQSSRPLLPRGRPLGRREAQPRRP